MKTLVFSLFLFLCCPLVVMADETPKLDAIQQQYITSFMRLNLEINLKRNNALLNYRLERTQSAREDLELRYRRRIPYDVKVNRAKLDREKTEIEQQIKDLEKEKEALKMDMLKYYKAEVPLSLSRQLEEVEKQYLDDFAKYNEDMTRAMAQ